MNARKWAVRDGRRAWLVLMPLLLAACATENVNKTPAPERDINSVMEAHTAELMAIPGVVGVAVSETSDKTPCIMVLLLDESEEIRSKLPQEIEGHPVCPFVSGEIKPMQEG